MQPVFVTGQIVGLKADSNRQGPVIEILTSPAGRVRYRVFHGPGDVREYNEEQLILVSVHAAGRDLNRILSPEAFLSAEEFHARLTAARLAHPLTDNLYALHAARIKFIPFQFKPLLRLLRADRPRILIADEVGVGKTIEAGLILKELQSRQRLENVLIVCPKALVTKWRREMQRFDEDFHMLTAETLRYCLKETHLDGSWPSKYTRAIVHLELFRNPDYLFGSINHPSRPGLATLDPPAQFSLAIFDEAHHLRNTETNSNQLARFICDNSEAVAFLSATPVQLGSKNLYALLNLLRPDMFPDEAVFNEMAAPNRPINQAMRHIRSRKPDASWQADARKCLADAASTSWGVRALVTDPRFQTSLHRISDSQPLTDAERIACLRDLEDIHTLAHVMNRTRRRDIGRFTIREPHTVNVPFTPAQSEFYRELLEFRRDMLLLRHDPIVIRLIIDMLERQAASCLPALIPALDSFLRTGRFSLPRFSDAAEEEDDEFDLPDTLQQRAQNIRRLAEQLSPEDPKLDALLTLARTTCSGEGPRKLLVFSFFLHTLDYLAQKLENAGLRVGVVTGRMPDEADEEGLGFGTEATRQKLRDRFRLPSSDPNAIDVLLSSEVGCEGLDYEFCDRMVNYDIPWNPMRLEQRIGRIDRFGQQSEKILIFNFVTPGTVEERIFFRCFQRLGIFRDTIGDCEEVLGELSVTEQLLQIARNPNLTPDQAEEKARQISDNAVRLVEERQRLEKEGGSLLGLDQALTEEVNEIDAKGRFVSPDELRAMIGFFLAQSGTGGKLEADKENPRLFRLRLNKDARTSLAAKLRAWRPIDRNVNDFRRWLEGGDQQYLLTFDQQTALDQRNVPFITPVHPLARIATDQLRGMERPLSACLRIRTGTVRAGAYVFMCDLWETVAVKPELRLVSIAFNIDDGQSDRLVAEHLLALLLSAESATPPPGILDTAVAALATLDEQMHAERDAALADLLSRNSQLVARKLASLDAYHQNRLARISSEIAAARDEKIIRMKTSERARVERDHAAHRQAIEQRQNADIVRERIAVGILEVIHVI